MTKLAAVLDACVLVPMNLTNVLLWLAEAEMFEPLWSDPILAEVERALPRVGVTPQRATHRVAMMRDAFGAAAVVDDFHDLIDQMACDPKDRHVLAAAVRAEADAVVTFNLKDFPDSSAGTVGVEMLDPDEFLVRLLVEDPAAVVDVLERGVAQFVNPPRTLLEFLAFMTAVAPMFANLTADALLDPPGPVTDMPALVASDDGSGLAALGGTTGDPTIPGQVAMGWWSGVFGNLELARALSYDSTVWGDYSSVAESLTGWSLASKVIPAVDAPERIVFMRFVPDVVGPARVFQAFATRMTFLILVKVEDETWRVWGLRPRMVAANDILG